MKTTKPLILAAALIVGATGVAAADCQSEIALINDNLTSTAPVTPEEMQEVIRLRNLGEAECNAGNEARGLAYLADAKAILGIN